MKLAVITGSSSGIGAATARQFATDGYKVVLVARQRAKLEDVAAEIGDQEQHDSLLQRVDSMYEPRYDAETGEFGYWFNLNERYPRGQWNNAVMNAFVAPAGTWSTLLE